MKSTFGMFGAASLAAVFGLCLVGCEDDSGDSGSDPAASGTGTNTAAPTGTGPMGSMSATPTTPPPAMMGPTGSTAGMAPTPGPTGDTAGGTAMGPSGPTGEMMMESCPPGEPPISVHNPCEEIASYAMGDEAFTITSPAFEFCGEMSADLTCDGKEFGTGASPELNWSGAPEGTMSYALVFKDIAILADNDPETERFAYHWVMWDIPADVMGLPAGLSSGFQSAEVPGALQWATRGEYGFFPPCPNPFPADHPAFSCELVIDSYSYTLYALPTEKLADLPEPDLDPETGMPTGNWVVNMGHYIESLDALAVAEHRGTSGAWSTAFAPPDPPMYPCTQAQIDAGTTEECLLAAPVEEGCPEGEPPISVHNPCEDIPTYAMGDEGFMITSPDFDFCGEMAADLTCDGKEFGTGASPALEWTGAPEGTMSYALVFKDIAILADNDPETERFAYHWVMWDIPPDVLGLPAGLTGGYESTEVPGALQWATRGNYGYFPPCPNPFPADHAAFSCELVIDSYSFTLYALPTATLADLPAPDLDPETGMPTGNWVVNMGHYIESLDALAIAEHRGTSGAWSTAFAPPDPPQFPCAAVDNIEAAPDAGAPAADAGAPPACLE